MMEDDFMIKSNQNENEMKDYVGIKSGLSSPGESVVSLTDSESDEDDYIIGLTTRMAHSTLEEEDQLHANGHNKVCGLSGSPKSPLCRGLVGYGGNQGFRNCEARCLPNVTSFPMMYKNEGALDLAGNAAGEAGNRNLVEEFGSNNGLFVPLEQSSSNFGLSYQQFQAARFEQLKKEQRQCMGVWVQENGGCSEFYEIKMNQQLARSRAQNGGRRPVGLPSPGWPTLQQPGHPGSGRRAIFFGNPGANKERTGTGVFLPRRIGCTESGKNKPGCPTVLLPERVVQALNLNLEIVDHMPQVYARNIRSDIGYDASLIYDKKNQNNVERRQNIENSVRSQAVADEVQLPPEWIY